MPPWANSKGAKLRGIVPKDINDLEIEADLALEDIARDRPLLRSFFDAAVANFNGANVSILINLTDFLPPGPFTLTLPADGAGGVPLPDDVFADWALQPALRWTRPNSFAEPTYNVKLATDPGLTSIVAQSSGLTQRQFDVLPGVLQAGTTYYWGVTAFNQAGSRVSTPVAALFSTAGFCLGDANNDGVVDFGDITTVLGQWLNTCP